MKKSIIFIISSVFLLACSQSNKKDWPGNEPRSGNAMPQSCMTADTICLDSNIEVYVWPYRQGPTYSRLKERFGKERIKERVEYEHCFDKNDTVKAFFCRYIAHPDEYYDIVTWKDVDSTGENLVLYLGGTHWEKQAFWGYRYRLEDFTTDIYKVK